MHQLKIGNIQLKKVYVCSPSEAKDARAKGIPYIVKPKSWTDEQLAKAVLYRTLCKLFPYINWANRFFGCAEWNAEKRMPIVNVPAEYRENPGFDTNGCATDEMQVSDGYRMTAGGFDEDGDESWRTNSIGEFFGDFGSYVNLEELQQLRILPQWMDDIATAIKTNFNSMAWWDGYNKKLGVPTGYYSDGSDAPNLIILDTSGSIPRGIAFTMISLIDTLRHQANADLIITSGRSKYWAANEELPEPEELKGLVGGCNEATQFYQILRNRILGKHWGNVIIFGDNDAPTDRRLYHGANRDKQRDKAAIKDTELQSTRIDNIMAFHTYSKDVPGYGLWAQQAAPNAPITFNTKWTEFR